MTRQEFEQHIREAIDALPPNIRAALENVAFVVEDEPQDADLLGLYHGVPRTKRGAAYSMVLPDKITIYKRMIEDEARRPDDLPGLIRLVVWHEIGHHLGFGEKEIRRLEEKWERERKV